MLPGKYGVVTTILSWMHHVHGADFTWSGKVRHVHVPQSAVVKWVSSQLALVQSLLCYSLMLFHSNIVPTNCQLRITGK